MNIPAQKLANADTIIGRVLYASVWAFSSSLGYLLMVYLLHDKFTAFLLSPALILGSSTLEGGLICTTIFVALCGAITSFIRRPFVQLGLLIVIFVMMSKLGSYTSQQRIANSRMQYSQQMAHERTLLSGPNVDFAALLRDMKTPTDDGTLEFIYMLRRHPDLAKPGIPTLKQIIRDDESHVPFSTVIRKSAAQTIYKISGERVTYKGFDKDKERFADPYDPHSERKSH